MNESFVRFARIHHGDRSMMADESRAIATGNR
jgi:hypothetical protein